MIKRSSGILFKTQNPLYFE